MAEYPTEENVYPTGERQQQFAVQSSHSAASATNRHVDPAAGSVTSNEVRAARVHLEQRKADHDAYVHAVMQEHDFHEEALPSLQELREERVRLSEQIRHHKDEQDSLTLDIEGQDGATEVYQIAARVQRYEHFAARSKAYVNNQLPQEVDQVVEEDQRHSEEEIAAYIQELQTRRENTLKKVSDFQASSAKRGGNKDDEATFADDEDTKEAIAHAESNVTEAQTLSEKVKKFRALKTKLNTELVREKQDSKKIEQQYGARLRNAELINARNARQCKELNSGNGAITTNAQLLMSQLNVEHYGMDNAPTNAQMIEERRAREATPEPTPVNHAESERRSRRQGGDNASMSSRQSRPPLVALKPTASQKSRDEASQREREEQRRSSEVGSHTSSRRQSLSKPPLVASKPTASQMQRDEAIQRERDEQSASRSLPRAMSNGSESRPPAAASKSTESQRNRTAVAAN